MAMIDIWNKLGKSARIGLMAGVLAMVLAMLLSWWMLRADYQVLFSDLAPQDAGAMVAELERLKIAYRLEQINEASAILVDSDVVHQTRIKLMSKELPLHGAVGFELFNNTDFGMTEFAQKINYQRALQGEITRTILSLAEIQAARVHLALPEEGLFKRATSVPKAAITLSIKPGHALRAEQVSGIQRLVASAVPAIAIPDVTIVDQQGIALTGRSANDDTSGIGESSRLTLKKETETYLGRKVAEVLEHAFGTGQAMARVDVTLDMDQVRTTTEDVLAPPLSGGGSPSGTIVREKETLREGTPLLDAKSTGASGASSQRDVEYSVGRRVEQVVAVPGAIRHIHVVAVVRRTLDSDQLERIQQVVAAAVGASSERGDTIVVQPLAALGGEPASARGALAAAPAAFLNMDRQADPESPQDQMAPILIVVLVPLACLLLFATGGVLWWRRSHATKEADTDAATAGKLSEVQKQAMLAQVQTWMQQKDAGTWQETSS